MLRISDLNDFIELDVVSQEDANVPSRGDAYVTVRVASAGFIGHNDLWVSVESLQEFCRGLVELERTRRGHARLQSISEGELELAIRAINFRGSMAIEGKTGYHVQRENQLYWHEVQFGFEFDPSQLIEAALIDWVRRNSLI